MGWVAGRVEKALGANVPVPDKQQAAGKRPGQPGALRRREKGQR